MNLPDPDTHCFDDDTQQDVWSYSKELVEQMLAQDAMEAAMQKMAIAAPQLGDPVVYTKKQIAIIERYRTEMAAAGGMFPSWWQHKSSTEIAQAAIEAVREYKP